jgi:hypothetical protein
VDNLKASPVKITWHPGLSIYASESFLKLSGNEYGWLGGIDVSGKVRCVLPYTIIKKPGFRIVRFRVETILFDGELNLPEEKAFLNSALSYFRVTGADMIIPPTTNTIFRTYPDGAIAAPYGTYIIDINQPEESLWSNLNSTYRKKIRNSIRNGVEIRNGFEHLNTCYKLIQNTLKPSKLGFMPFDEFKRLVIGLGENVKVLVAYYKGNIQGCTIFPFSSYSAYSLYGGKIPEAETGAMNFLNWEAIRQFQQQGVKRFDFVGVRIDPEKGSKQEGIKTFKQRFGGELIQGYMWKYSFRPIKFALYSIAVRLLRGGDIVDQERRKLIAKEMLG